MIHDLTRGQEQAQEALALRHGGVRVNPGFWFGEVEMVDPAGVSHWITPDGRVRHTSGPTSYELVPATYPRSDSDGD